MFPHSVIIIIGCGVCLCVCVQVCVCGGECATAADAHYSSGVKNLPLQQINIFSSLLSRTQTKRKKNPAKKIHRLDIHFEFKGVK